MKIIPDYDGIMFMSPAAVNSFVEENDILRFNTIFAIGQTTKAHLENFVTTPVITGRQASREALTDAVIEYFIE